MTDSKKEAAATAKGPAELVLLEQTFAPQERLLTDELSVRMAPTGARFWYHLCKLGFFRNLIFRLDEKLAPGMWALFVCRKRYIQEQAHESLKNGAAQVVNLGAGQETLLARDEALHEIPCFEVDLPVNSQAKRAALEKALGETPAHLCLVPVDFAEGTLAEELRRAGYDSDKPTCFIWEAVTQYLDETAVRSTFEFLGEAASGSRVVFTYVQKDFLEGRDDYGLGILRKKVAGDPPLWLFGLNPSELDAFVEPFGFRVLSNVGSDEVARRYTEGKQRCFAATALEPIAVIEKT